MKITENEDGSISYTLTAAERMVLWAVVGFVIGRRTGYSRGRHSLAKELEKTGVPQP